MHDAAKEAAAHAALKFVKPGMLIGLGTGSTATFFIDALIKKCQQGLKISAVSSSLRSLEQAQKGHIPIVDINTLTSIDLVVDGADEIDPELRLIKGGGGALLREKIIANMAKEVVIIADNSKLVERLGKFSLPVEILPYAYLATISHLSQQGFHGTLRKNAAGDIYLTDNGNYIIDVHFPDLCHDPESDNHKIRSIPGVLETGFFFHLASQALIGYPNGKVTNLR